MLDFSKIRLFLLLFKSVNEAYTKLAKLEFSEDLNDGSAAVVEERATVGQTTQCRRRR
jgi:hypothetical protein